MESVWLAIAVACSAGALTFVELSLLADAGRIHTAYTSEGHLLICADSLRRSTTEKETQEPSEAALYPAMLANHLEEMK